MFELLDRLRNKPEHYRRTIAIAIVSIITGVIFLIWASDMLTRLSRASTEEGVEGVPSSVIESASVFSSLKDQLGAIFESGAGVIDSIRGPIEYNSSNGETQSK